MVNGASPTAGAFGGWLPGLVLGVATGFLLLELGTIGLGFALVSVILIAWKGPRLAASAGFLTGAGLIWTVLFARVAVSCAIDAQLPGEDCEAPGIVPWILVATVTFGLGLITSAVAFARSLRR